MSAGREESPLLCRDTGLYAVELASRFPRLHTQGWCPEISISPGWRLLCERLLNQIDEVLSDEEAKGFKLLQVKEKFGTLRVYYRLGDAEDLHVDLVSPEGREHLVKRAPGQAAQCVRELVDAACSKSEEICEICGRLGELREGGWIRTLCDEHEAERQHPAFQGFIGLTAREQAFEALRRFKLEGFDAMVHADRLGEPVVQDGTMAIFVRETDPERLAQAAEVMKHLDRYRLFRGDLFTVADLGAENIERIFRDDHLVFSNKTGLELVRARL